MDASIRGLRLSGYLPFRMRAMIVSFAVHVLRLWWRDILYPMAQWMADYVPGIHLSQLQMQAALTGINTIRVYDPTKQLTDHDRDARFVRAMVAELRHRDPAEIRALPDLRLPPYPPQLRYSSGTDRGNGAGWIGARGYRTWSSRNAHTTGEVTAVASAEPNWPGGACSRWTICLCRHRHASS